VDFTKAFKQTGLFPSRKINPHNIKKLAKSSTATPHHVISPVKGNEGTLRYQIVKSIKHEIEPKPTSRMSVRTLKNGHATTVSNAFNN
jgi:hypothetical protein